MKKSKKINIVLFSLGFIMCSFLGLTKTFAFGLPGFDTGEGWEDCCEAVWDDVSCKCGDTTYSYMKKK